MNRRARILFCSFLSSSFVKMDLELLKRHFDVRIPEFGVSFGARTFLRQLFHYVTRFSKNRRTPSSKFPPLDLVRCLLWADLTFSWFAAEAYSAVLLSKMFRKKSVVVVGGYGVADVPEIGYGYVLDPRHARHVKFALETADRIIPFSDFAKKEVLNITAKADINMIPLACDTEKFKPSRREKEDIVLTVCYVTKGNIARKGLETFLESARLLPKIKFILVGGHIDESINYLRKMSSSNVEFTGYISEKNLIKWYQKAKVYCQLSYQEGFGVATIEAMACECIPVVSSKAVVLRETVGDCGFYVPYGDAKATAKAIKKALSAPCDTGVKARARVKRLFSIEKREKELLRSINDAMYGRE